MTMYIRKTLEILGLLLTLASTMAAGEKTLAPPRLVRALTDEVSGEIAFRYTDRISGFDRVQGTDGYHAAAEMVRAELLRLGYKDAAIEGWPSDGTSRFYTSRSVIGWRVKNAELWMTSPTRERLCYYEETPMTLVKYSGSGHVQAELVDVGSGVGAAAYRNKDVKGKIVLSTAATEQVMQEAVVNRGALGVLTYFAADQLRVNQTIERGGYPNLIRYTALWPRWEDRDKVGFGFNISKNQGATLKRMLEEGQKIVLKADVDTEFYQTQIEILSASFQGTVEPNKEIIILGHLCHPMPSANDNASGSGGMLEMARALKVMVESGAIEPPKRTIRFLWVPEGNGTVPYIQAHLERTRNAVAAINCDMIGDDLDKTGGILFITRTPDSLPSFLGDVVVNFATLADELKLTSLNGSAHPFVWKSTPYSGGSDHSIFNDGSLRVPATMLGRGDTFLHTTLDTIDKVDPTELRRSCFIALGSAYYIASAGDKEASDMARVIARNGYGRMAADYYDSLNELYGAANPDNLHSAYQQILNVIAHSGRRETQSVLSTLAFVKDKAVEKEIASLNGLLESALVSFPKDANTIYTSFCAKAGVAPKARTLSDTEKAIAQLVPVRAENFVCPLQRDFLVEKLGPSAAGGARLSGNASYEALNFVDGKRNLHDIYLAVLAECGPVDPGQVRDFFTLMEKAGLIRMTNKSN